MQHRLAMADASRILVVDDDAAMRAMLEDQLGAAGYDVCAADGVEGALAQLDAHPFAAVLSDLHMRPRDGLALLAAVRRRDEAPPVILMTSFASEETMRRALQEGAAGLLAKPFDPADLLAELDRVVRR